VVLAGATLLTLAWVGVLIWAAGKLLASLSADLASSLLTGSLAVAALQLVTLFGHQPGDELGAVLTM